MSNLAIPCMVGDVFFPCVVIGESDRYFYLNDMNYTESIFDLVLTKDERDNDQDLHLDLKIGDFVKVKAYDIMIGHDGRPCAFVELIEKYADDIPELIKDSDREDEN